MDTILFSCTINIWFPCKDHKYDSENSTYLVVSSSAAGQHRLQCFFVIVVFRVDFSVFFVVVVFWVDFFLHLCLLKFPMPGSSTNKRPNSKMNGPIKM